MADRKPMFDGNEGEIILSSAAEALKKGHQSRKKELMASLTENYIEAEFFGIKKFNQLMEQYKDTCVGFRVYYGSQWEDHSKSKTQITAEGKGKKTSRLVIVPVDAYGRDLTSNNVMGLKDMAGGGAALANGPMCPRHCAPPVNEDEN